MRNIFKVFLVIALLSFVTSCDFIKKQNKNVTSDAHANAPAQNEKPTNVENLHPNAKKFINDLLPGYEIARVIVDDDEFKVWLTTGEMLDFDLDGGVKEIESAAGIPEAVIDEHILKDVKSLDPDASIVRIDKKSDGGFDVKLNTGKEIVYDAGYNRIGIND